MEVHATLAEGVTAFNAGHFYEFHEILEPLWKHQPAQTRPFFQGLIQVASAYLKLERGEQAPAMRLFDAGVAKLEPFCPETYGLDVEGLVRQARSARARLAARAAADPVAPRLEWTDPHPGLPPSRGKETREDEIVKARLSEGQLKPSE